MSCFMGEIVQWTPGAAHATVKPKIKIEGGFARTLNPKEIEVEFLGTRHALWDHPTVRCKVGRWILFKKGPIDGGARVINQYQILPVLPRVIVNEPKGPESTSHSVESALGHIAEELSFQAVHILAQDFKVFLKRGGQILDYFGPFEQKGPKFMPPPHFGTVKRYRAREADLSMVHLRLDGQSLDILQPQIDLVKTREFAMEAQAPNEPGIPPPSSDLLVPLSSSEPTVQENQRTSAEEAPSLAEAIETLDSAIPIIGFQQDLKDPEESLPQAESLSQEGINLIRDTLKNGEETGVELQTLLTILQEHANFSEFFEKELEAQKLRQERDMETEVERRVEATIREIIQEEKGRTLQASAQEGIAVEGTFLAPDGEMPVQTGPPMGSSAQVSPAAETGLASLRILPALGQRLTALEAQASLMAHLPMARLQTAWSVGRIPLLVGPRSLSLAKTYADLFCGGSLRWASIDPLLTKARDLLGIFVDGWFRPHPSGIASLLAQHKDADHASLVVFEGANRVPLELLLEPLLHSRDVGLPLFAEEAFRPDDPWAVLGQTPWPPLVLIACTLTTGAAKQPISPFLWDRVMAVDEAQWPRAAQVRERSYLPAAGFGTLIQPLKDQDGEIEIQEFLEEIAVADCANPGVLKVIQHMEGLDLPNAVEEGLTLLLAAGALCAGATPASMGTLLQAPDLRRIERLQPFLV